MSHLQKVFTRADNLKQHQQIHINEKQHDCPKCDNELRRKSDLLRHEKQVHERRAAQREYKMYYLRRRIPQYGAIPSTSKFGSYKILFKYKNRPRDEETGRKQ